MDNNKNKHATLEDDRSKIWFSFIDPQGYNKIIGLGYDSKSTYEYDKGYDAKSYDYLKNDLYWLLGSEKLVIRALPEINIEDNLPLGIKVTNAGLYKFSINKMENVPDDLNIYLLDNSQKVYYNLKNGEAQLALKTGTDQNQYSIVFKEGSTLSSDTFEEKNIITTYDAKTKILQLHSGSNGELSQIDTLVIYNSLGQEALNINLPNTNRIDVSHLSDGVYILQLNSKITKESMSVKFVKY